jgi:hypothetical protein
MIQTKIDMIKQKVPEEIEDEEIILIWIEKERKSVWKY